VTSSPSRKYAPDRLLGVQGDLRTSRLARSRWWPTLLVDCLIGVAGTVALAWFVWPAHENPDPNAIFVLDLLWAVAGSVISLGVQRVAAA
jgi:hypothetical protein